MSIHPHQWSDEALCIASKHTISPDFVEACLRLCPDTIIVAQIAALAAVTNTYLAYVALTSIQQAMQTTNTHTDSEYAI